MDPISLTVTRYRCPFCPKSYSNKRRAVLHIADCWRNPAVRSCGSCAYREPPCCPGGAPDCGCGGADSCGEGLDMFVCEPNEPLRRTRNCPAWKQR